MPHSTGLPRLRGPRFSVLVLLFGTAFLLSPQSPTALADEAAAPPAVDFVRDIQPLFAAHCFECHGPERQEGGLRLNVRASAFGGGDSGQKAIVPGNAPASRLLRVISGQDDELTMPPEGEGEPLSAEQVALVTRWIAEGAAWPAEADAPQAKPSHWAWHRPAKAALPPVKSTVWPRHPIDHFVLKRLEGEALSPAPEADRHTLVRRVHLDLIGLPPTPEQVTRFINDTAPGAYERMVDRALADPAYGERWARVWLDLARYADSKGYGSDPLRTIWRYRDWVIEAFNRNLPYDQFTIEQLAGDLLPNPTSDQILATAFHRNTMANDEGGTDDEEFRVAAVKDRIETTMQVWMGLTFGCAKCHSHKFDPITQREYYQGYAFFNQTEDADRNDEEPKASIPTRAQAEQIAQLQAELATLRRQLDSPPAGLEAELAAWEANLRQQDAAWRVLEIAEATTTDGEKLEKLPEGSLRASGAGPERTTYRLQAVGEFKGVTGVRLEASPDETLPQGGPGRAEGNFVLNEFRLLATPANPSPTQGRFVRIELTGEKQILSLAEVQVLHGAENLATTGQASQSSTSFQGPAQLAIDGRTEGDFDQKSVTHTNEENHPWWELDLGKVQPVERIVVWNRTDHGLQFRLKGFVISLLDDQRNPIWQQTVADAPKSHVELDLSAPTQLALSAATADFSQKDFAIDKAIDGDPAGASGWAIAPELGKRHEAIFALAQPLSIDGPARLQFELVQAYGGRHTLGRLRLSVTNASSPGPAIPQKIRELLALAPEAHTAEATAELTRYYWSQSPQSAALRAEVVRHEATIAEVQKQLAPTPIMRELPADKRRVTHTMVKGNFQSPGEQVEPTLPAAFHPLPAGAPLNRMGLAQWLIARDNPLTARVAVNRLWAQLFGAGLVATEEDFGTQGLPPSHPEVLDWLAVELMDGGWDLKEILRQIVSSATYRQSSTPSAVALERDPYNRLLARGPRFRLEAEMVRDQALAISGLLSRKQGGPSVYPPQPPNLWRAAFNGERTWATSSGEDRYRRGLYTYWRRTVPYPSMAAFDAPSREICTLRRIATNTPLQAFVTLNDPVYVEAAQALARRIVAEGGSTPEARARFVLELALARPAEQPQIEQVAALYASELAHYRQDREAAATMATDPLGPLPAGLDAAELAAWTVVSNVVLNLDGVLSKR